MSAKNKFKAKLQAPCVAPSFKTITYDGKPIDLSSYLGKRVLLCFYRNAGCPVCNRSIYDLIAAEPLLKQHGVELITIFESKAEKFPKYIGGKKTLPFPMIADHNKTIYRLYGVEPKLSAIFRPAVIWKILKSLLLSKKGDPVSFNGDLRQIPAYFVLSPEGTIQVLYYGKHIADTIQSDQIHRLLEAM